MFKIESLLSKHLIAVFGLMAVLCISVVGTGCAGVTDAPKSASTSRSASVQVSPSTVTLQLGATQQFSASATGVTWSATGGTISSSGLYTAPNTPGTYVVQATSTADATQSGSAAVTVISNSTTPQISFSPAQLSFGTVAVNATGTQTLRITNVGGGTLTISQFGFTGDNVFSVTGATLPPSIASGKSATVQVAFAPVTSGSFTASLSASSNANNSTASVTLSGSTSASASTHSVALNWSASSSSVVGYMVYRGTVSGGPYTRLISSADAATTYTDSSVQSGATYYYVVTAVDGSGIESPFSNQATAVVPSP